MPGPSSQRPARRLPRARAAGHQDAGSDVQRPPAEHDNACAAEAGDRDELRLLVGSRLRAFREARGVTVRALAKNVGLTPGFISQIENGRVMPSIANLVRFCAALGIEVGDVFSGSVSKGRIVRAPDRRVYVWEMGIRDEIVSADSTKRLELMHSTFAPGGTTGEPFTHGSEIEVAFVLKGRITVTVGDERFELEAGEALTFSGTMPHAVANSGTTEAEVIWALTPATF